MWLGFINFLCREQVVALRDTNTVRLVRRFIVEVEQVKNVNGVVGMEVDG